MTCLIHNLQQLSIALNVLSLIEPVKLQQNPQTITYSILLVASLIITVLNLVIEGSSVNC